MEAYTFMIIYRSDLLKMRNFHAEVVEKIKTHVVCSMTIFFFFENRAVHETVWKNIIIELDRSQMTIWCMCVACWITKAINTHWEYVITIAFPRQQWVSKHSSVLVYTYIACLVS